jgi:hypothetical protein
LVLATCSVHRLTGTVSTSVANESQLQRTTAILVTRELGDGCLSVLDRVELHNTSTLGASIAFVLNLRLLDWTDRGEEVNEIFVASRPGELFCVNLIY